MQTLRRLQVAVPWSGAKISRLCLGTAQFGMNYGVANQIGQPNQSEIEKIVECAWESGIDLFDTAQAYGTSEECLGKALKALGMEYEVKVISKIHPSLEKASAQEVTSAVQKSLLNLGVPRLFSLMLHREEWLNNWKHFQEVGQTILHNKLAESLGVSIYTLKGFEAALAIDEIKTIQMPFNLFDQRARTEQCFERAAKAGKLLFVRSIYLQGLLTMKESNAPERLSFARPYLVRLQQALSSLNLPASKAAFQFAAQHAESAVMVVGAETLEQVQQNVRMFNTVHSFSDKENEMLFGLGENVPVKLIDPSQWTAA